MPTINIDGYRLEYTVEGSPDLPLLLLLHGCLSHRGVWSATMDALSAHYYCVAVDMLGFGDSDKPAGGDYNIKAQGERVVNLAEKLGFERFSLIGHSMGGQTSLYIASVLAPEKVQKMVSVSGVVTGPLSPFVDYVICPGLALAEFIPATMVFWRWLNKFRRYSYFHYQSWFYKMDFIPYSDWETDRWMSLQPGIEFSGYRAMKAIHEMNLEKELKNITAPTLAIFGRQDGTVPVEDGHKVKKYVPDSELILLDECGHFPMYEKPQEYLDVLRAFLLN